MIDKETLNKAADAAERTHEGWCGWEDVATAVLEAAGYSELQAHARDLEARNQRAGALHVAEGNGYCVVCWDFNNDTDVPFPCPTIDALTATEGQA